MDFVTHGLKLPKAPQHRARERFVASLRAYVLIDLANELRSDYEQEVLPALADKQAPAPKDGVAVHKLMRGRDQFNFYSSLRCTAQEIVWDSVIDFLEGQQPLLDERFTALSEDQSVAGSLQLNPSLKAPGYYDVTDVHLMPGNYDAHGKDTGLAPGSLYDNGFNVFAFGAMGREFSDIGWSMAQFTKLRFPELNPQCIVDVGCTVGHNTLPWKQTFPDARVHGLDLAAGCLKYGHARAQSMGIEAHFQQARADHLPFEDNSVDVVFSSMFLHELPLKHIQATLAEAFRVLRPGGVMLHMELPPNAPLAPYDQFYLDWDSYYNSEPFYKNFRDQDYQQLCTDAGFDRDRFFQAVMPRFTYVEESEFESAVMGEAKFDEDTGRLSHDIEWYGFGAVKGEES